MKTRTKLTIGSIAGLVILWLCTFVAYQIKVSGEPIDTVHDPVYIFRGKLKPIGYGYADQEFGLGSVISGDHVVLPCKDVVIFKGDSHVLPSDYKCLDCHDKELLEKMFDHEEVF